MRTKCSTIHAKIVDNLINPRISVLQTGKKKIEMPSDPSRLTRKAQTFEWEARVRKATGGNESGMGRGRGVHITGVVGWIGVAGNDDLGK